jgi:hypothetical protein
MCATVATKFAISFAVMENFAAIRADLGIHPMMELGMQVVKGLKGLFKGTR